MSNLSQLENKGEQVIQKNMLLTKLNDGVIWLFKKLKDGMVWSLTKGVVPLYRRIKSGAKFIINAPQHDKETAKFIVGVIWLVLTIFLLGLANTIVLDTWNRLGLATESTEQSHFVRGFAIAIQLLPAGLLAGGSLIEIVRGILSSVTPGWFRSIFAPFTALSYLIIVLVFNTWFLPLVAHNEFIPRIQQALDTRDLTTAEFYADLAIKFSSFNTANMIFASEELSLQENIEIISNFTANTQTSDKVDVMVMDEDGILKPARQWSTFARFGIARLHELQPQPNLQRIQDIYETLLRIDGCWLAAAWQYGELVNFYTKTQLSESDSVLQLMSAQLALDNAIVLLDNRGLYITTKCEERYPLIQQQNDLYTSMRYWLHMTRGETLLLMGEYAAAYEDFDHAVMLSIGAQSPLNISNLIVSSPEDYSNPSLLVTQAASRAIQRAFIRRVHLARLLDDDELMVRSEQELCHWLNISIQGIPISTWPSDDIMGFYNLDLTSFNMNENTCDLNDN